MSGYLQRLVDGVAPATLAPVVKSTSPVFEHNQLLGLAGFEAEQAEVPLAEAPDTRRAGAPSPASPALPTVAPAPQAYPPETPAPRPEAVPGLRPQDVRDVPAAPVPQEISLAPMTGERATTAAMPAAGFLEAALPPPEGERPAESRLALRDLTRAIEPAERGPDAPPAVPLLEPTLRRDFEEAGPGPRPAAPEPAQTPPQITIGQVTVEVVPDREPAARPARSPRTAEAASVIGPLGSRRTRRGSFALSRS